MQLCLQEMAKVERQMACVPLIEGQIAWLATRFNVPDAPSAPPGGDPRTPSTQGRLEPSTAQRGGSGTALLAPVGAAASSSSLTAPASAAPMVSFFSGRRDEPERKPSAAGNPGDMTPLQALQKTVSGWFSGDRVGTSEQRGSC